MVLLGQKQQILTQQEETGLGTGTTTAGLIYGGWPRAGKN